MPKVHLLEDELINKIAAGEVVERPASVVKELVENAIDAGATHIEVELLDGGKGLISIRDNGYGMIKVMQSCPSKRHCTSKSKTWMTFSKLELWDFVEKLWRPFQQLVALPC